MRSDTLEKSHRAVVKYHRAVVKYHRAVVKYQTPIKSREKWPSHSDAFGQHIDVSAHQGKKFCFTGYVKVESNVSTEPVLVECLKMTPV